MSARARQPSMGRRGSACMMTTGGDPDPPSPEQVGDGVTVTFTNAWLKVQVPGGCRCPWVAAGSNRLDTVRAFTAC